MTRYAASLEQRLFDLLASRATEGLGEWEMIELEGLLRSFPVHRADELDQAAAVINLAMMNRAMEPLPESLRDRLMIDAGIHFGARIQNNPGDELTTRRSQLSQAPRRLRRIGGAPWFLAAASVVLAISGLWTIVDRGGSPQPALLLYKEFLENSDLVRAFWIGTDERFATVSGEVLWSNASQTGVMRFVGLAPNDPERLQYQLWIIDPNRDRYPVDGGVFNVPIADEVIVPIRAKLRVDRPRTFAITLEKAGGVVVSEGPLLLVGSVPGETGWRDESSND